MYFCKTRQIHQPRTPIWSLWRSTHYCWRKLAHLLILKLWCSKRGLQFSLMNICVFKSYLKRKTSNSMNEIVTAREGSLLQETFPWCSVEKVCGLWERQLTDFQTQHHRKTYGSTGSRENTLITDRYRQNIKEFLLHYLAHSRHSTNTLILVNSFLLPQ